MNRSRLQVACFGPILIILPALPAFAQQGISMRSIEENCGTMPQGDSLPVVSARKKKKRAGLMGLLRAAGPLGGLVGGVGGAAASSVVGAASAAAFSEVRMPRSLSSCRDMRAKRSAQEDPSQP